MMTAKKKAKNMILDYPVIMFLATLRGFVNG